MIFRTIFAGELRFKGTIKVSDDLNNITTSCNYLVNGDQPKNYPKGAYDYGAIIIENIGNITIQKVVTHRNAESYVRVKYDNAENEWNEWHKISCVKVSL